MPFYYREGISYSLDCKIVLTARYIHMIVPITYFATTVYYLCTMDLRASKRERIRALPQFSRGSR